MEKSYTTLYKLIIMKLTPDQEVALTAINKFKAQREKYLEYFKAHPEAILKNMVFGELNKYEWYLIERKHLNHHFEQFGLI